MISIVIHDKNKLIFLFFVLADMAVVQPLLTNGMTNGFGKDKVSFEKINRAYLYSRVEYDNTR